MKIQTPFAPRLSRNLRPALLAILTAELEAGNQVAEWRPSNRARDAVFVRLREPFKVRHPSPQSQISRVEVADPTWWMVEYVDESTRDRIAYGF